MNRLVIVGNGFDLSLRLKTSYDHFLTHYIKECINKVCKNAKSHRHIIFDNKIGNSFQYKDELIVLKIPERLNVDSLLKEIEKFDSFSKLSNYLIEDGYLEIKYELLSEIQKNSSLNNWVEIELLYFDTLFSIFKKYRTNQNYESVIREYHKKFNILKLKLIEYLSNIKIDYEKYDVQFYLDNFFEKLFKSDDGDSQNIEKVVFLNFNYTKTIKSIKNNYFGNENFIINHIHGDVDEPDSVIFGFGDESDPKYITLKMERGTELFKNIKGGYYHMDTKYPKLISFLKEGDFEVYFVGHSCGSSDRTILHDILNNRRCKKIKIFHYRRDNPKEEFHEKFIEIMKYIEKRNIENLTYNKDDIILQLKEV